MDILFIGGTGIISTAVSKLAIEAGHNLTLFNRNTKPELAPKQARIITGDIRDKKQAARLLEKQTFDVVVDWVAYTTEHVETDIALFTGKTDQYFFISSASAYQKPPAHYLVNESTPLANPYWQYSRDKIACENRLLEEYRQNNFPAVIIRPSLTYGDQMIPAAINSWQHPWTLIDRMLNNKPVIIHGDGTSLWTMTHNTDLAAALIALFANPKTIGQAFHITCDDVLSWNQIYQQIADAAGTPLNAVHIPSDFIAQISPEETGNLLGDKSYSAVFDNTKIKQYAPAWHPKTPFVQGVKQSIQWFKSSPTYQTIDKEYSQKMDKIITTYQQKHN